MESYESAEALSIYGVAQFPDLAGFTRFSDQ